MARDITFEITPSGFVTAVEITMSGFNDGVIDQYSNQKIVAGISDVIVKANDTSAAVVVNGNVILEIMDVDYCTLQGNPITAFSDVPDVYANLI